MNCHPKTPRNQPANRRQTARLFPPRKRPPFGPGFRPRIGPVFPSGFRLPKPPVRTLRFRQSKERSRMSRQRGFRQPLQPGFSPLESTRQDADKSTEADRQTAGRYARGHPAFSPASSRGKNPDDNVDECDLRRTEKTSSPTGNEGRSKGRQTQRGDRSQTTRRSASRDGETDRRPSSIRAGLSQPRASAWGARSRRIRPGV